MTGSAATGQPWHYFNRRVGLFIHWGLYAVDGWHEQQQQRARQDRADYGRLAARWRPLRFDPQAWVQTALQSGFEYLVLTAKHHDGFCLWPTRQTDFSVRATPDGRDLVGLLAEACAAADLPFGLYFSCVDWHHPAYPNQGRHHELPGPLPGDEPNLDQYLDFVRAQAEELCTSYGPLACFWWDNNVPEHVDPTINARLRELQPGLLINDRGFDQGDFGTPEREWDPDRGSAQAPSRPTEACQSLGLESWGWRAHEDYYTDRHLERSMAAYLARGANYLLNIGPRADGSLDPTQVAQLGRLADWRRRVEQAWRGTQLVPALCSQPGWLATARDNQLYLLASGEPLARGLKLPGLARAPQRAVVLNNDQLVPAEVALLPSEHHSQRPCLHLWDLPLEGLAHEAVVLRLDFERPVEALLAAPAG